jgi:hypothetical protein
VPEAGETLKRTGAKPGRCPTHPTEPTIASCAVCERGLCLACAIPVRGRVVGAECLGTLVEDPPEQPAPLPFRRARGDWFALAGFVIVLIASVFRWASSAVGGGGLGEAWTPHWSLLAVASAAVGATSVILVRRWGIRPLPAAACYALLALLVALGTVLHAVHPPPVSNVVKTWPWRFALLGATLALIGAGRKVVDATAR